MLSDLIIGLNNILKEKGDKKVVIKSKDSNFEILAITTSQDNITFIIEELKSWQSILHLLLSVILKTGII